MRWITAYQPEGTMRQLPLDGRCGRRGRGKERFVVRAEPQGSYVRTSGGYRRFVLVVELIFTLAGYREGEDEDEILRWHNTQMDSISRWDMQTKIYFESKGGPVKNKFLMRCFVAGGDGESWAVQQWCAVLLLVDELPSFPHVFRAHWPNCFASMEAHAVLALTGICLEGMSTSPILSQHLACEAAHPLSMQSPSFLVLTPLGTAASDKALHYGTISYISNHLLNLHFDASHYYI